MKYFFLSSSHLEDRIWFRDDDDFKVGMNYVAMAATRCEVGVVTFVLMSNHVHFVLTANSDREATRFFSCYKSFYSKYLNHKYSTLRFLRENTLDCQQVSTLNEHLERVIAYILMNPVAANICLHPTQYSWGCGNCYFTGANIKGRRVGSMSHREKRCILHSHHFYGEDAIVGDEGYILPASFIRKEMVEAIFRTPKRLDYFLRTSSKAKHALESERSSLPSFQDKSLIILTQDLCMSLYRKATFMELDDDERSRVVYELHRRSGADLKQLARILEIQPAKVAAILSQW